MDWVVGLSDVGLKRLFITTSAVNVSTAAFNLLTTVMLVRWFGASVYADFLVDLAYLSITAILLEIVPSNYSVFRVQDDPSRIRGIAALAVATALLLVVAAIVLGSVIGGFHANSVWIPPYAGALAVKRYLDIRLQSTGRLREYFGIDLLGAVIRVLLMGAFLWWGIRATDAVWASLTCATMLSQFFWFGRNRDEGRILVTSVTDRTSWVPLYKERRAYVPYYLGIVFKRVRDNLVPVLASYFFISREALGAFFLAYRGLVFTIGQVRVIEGLLNHRKTLTTAESIPFFHRAAVALIGQLICITASLGLMYSSGVDSLQLTTVIILSFVIWFYVFSMLKRAQAYSQFDTRCVNSSMIAYCVTGIILVWSFKQFGIRTENSFSLILVCAECASLWVMYQLTRDRRMKRE